MTSHICQRGNTRESYIFYFGIFICCGPLSYMQYGWRVGIHPTVYICLMNFNKVNHKYTLYNIVHIRTRYVHMVQHIYLFD